METLTDVMVDDTPPRGRRVFAVLGWGLFAIVCLFFFTLQKLPQVKIHSYVTGFIASQLAPMGIQFAAESGGIDIGLGIYYEMENVTLTKTDTGKTMKISRIEASPAILALLQGKVGAHLKLEAGQGSLTTTVLTRGDDTEVAFAANALNLGYMGVLPFLADLQGTAEITGEGDILGDFRTPSSLSGNIKIGLARVVLDQQTVMGMLPIQKTSVSDGVIDLTLGSGKALVNQFRLGKPGGSDDIQLTLSGEMKLGRSIESSEANLRGKAVLAEGLKHTIPPFMIQKYLTPDGGIGFRLNGPLNGMFPAPDAG